jgi:hypothetical protein
VVFDCCSHENQTDSALTDGLRQVFLNRKARINPSSRAKKCVPETFLKTPSSIKNFELVTIAMIAGSVAAFVYQNSTTKLFGPTAAVYVTTAVIMNLFLIYTITRAKSIVSRMFFTIATGLGIAFSLTSLFGISPLQLKVEAGVAAFLYIYLIVAFSSLYLLFSPASTKWLQDEAPVEVD